MGRLSWATWLYIAAVVGAATIILARVPEIVPATGFPRGYWVICATLALLFLICDSTPTLLGERQAAWSPSSAATLAAVVLLGPFGAIGAAMVGSIAVLSVRRFLPLAARLFNGAMYAVGGYAAGTTYTKLDGDAFGGPSFLFPKNVSAILAPPTNHYLPPSAWLTPFVAAAAVQVVVNHSLLWGMLRIDRQRRAAAKQAPPRWSTPLLLASDLGLAALGLIIAAVWTVLGPLSTVVVLVPIMVARWAMGQFADQQKAHAATLRALCQAVETKDFYTRGHSERVSRGSGMIARQIGMRPDRAEAVRFAGMLHDVGKLGVPTKVLQKEGRLTEEEYAAIQLHPMRGLEIVREIGFLQEALSGIMHHHERIDGRGYPMGFADDEIPEFARIIAVADAFDSMTSTRAYRRARRIGDAIAELRKGAGKQFDPRMVEAFIAALDQERWDVPKPAEPASDEVVTWKDHDDPMAPLQVAEGI